MPEKTEKLKFNGFAHCDTFTTYWQGEASIEQVTVAKGGTLEVPESVAKKLLADHGKPVIGAATVGSDGKVIDGKPTELVPIVKLGK